MPPKRNPRKLNKLQLKTLTLLQELARLPDMATPNQETGDVTITALTQQRGHHFDSQSGSAINLLHQSSNASVIAAPSPGKADARGARIRAAASAERGWSLRRSSRQSAEAGRSDSCRAVVRNP